MRVVHRNTPPPRQRSALVATPGSARSSVFESPSSPGGRPSDKRDATRHIWPHRTAADIGDSPLLEAELRLVPVDEGTEDVDRVEHEEETQREQVAANNAVLDAVEEAQTEVAHLRELLMHSNRQIEQLRSEVEHANSPLDSPDLRAQMARLVEAVISPDAPTAERDTSGGPDGGNGFQHPSSRAVSPSRPATKTPERPRPPPPTASTNDAVPKRQPGSQPSTNRSEHRGAKAQARSVRQQQQRLAEALSAGSSPKDRAAVDEIIEASSELPPMTDVVKEKPEKPRCPFCGMMTLDGGHAKHWIACGQKDAARRLHHLKFVIRPHLIGLKPADVWKRATELHLALKYWKTMHTNIKKYPHWKERIRGGRECIILSPSDLQDVVNSKLLRCPRGDSLQFGLTTSYTSGPWVSDGVRQGCSFCEVTRPPPDGSPAAEATDLEGHLAPIQGDPISGTKILRVEGTLVDGNLRSVLEHHAAKGTMQLDCCLAPSKSELVESYKALRELRPMLLGRSETEQKSWLTDMICTVADHGSDFLFDYGRDPSVRAPCPLCCCTREIGERVELHSLTQLVTHYFRDHWHKGDPQDRRMPDPRGALPAQPQVASMSATQGGSGHAPGQVEATQESHAVLAEKEWVLRTENGAKNPWARPHNQSSSYSHSAIRPNWNSTAAEHELEVNRKPRLARSAEAALFRNVQQDIVGADAADLFVCAVNMFGNGKQSHDIVELFGCGPSDVDSDPTLTSSIDRAEQAAGEATCVASTIGWARSCKGRYRVWVSTSGSLPGQTGFKIMLRCGDDRPVVYDGSWMKGHVIDDLLVFDFLLDTAPCLETGKYDQIAVPYKQLQVSDLWGLGRSTPAMVDLLMLQLDSQGDYLSSAHLDAKNTSTEWRRADSPGKVPDTSPWRLSGETVLSHSYWEDQENRNHRINVNLDYIAPDVDSLVFIAKARPQLDGDEYTLSASIDVPQIVLIAPTPTQTSGARQSDRLLGTYSCPVQNLRRFNGGDAVVMCRLYRKRATGSPSNAEWANFESPFFKQPRAQRAPVSNRRSPAMPTGGHMGEDGIVPMSPDQVAFYSDAPRCRSEAGHTAPRTTSPSTQTVVGQQVQPGLQGNAVRTLVTTVRDGKDSEVTRPHLSIRVGGGWVSVPKSPRPRTATRTSTPDPSRTRTESPGQGRHQIAQVSSPDSALEKAVLPSEWFLQTIGLPLKTQAPNRAVLRWDTLRAAHTSATRSARSKGRFREICDEMKGWPL